MRLFLKKKVEIGYSKKITLIETFCSVDVNEFVMKVVGVTLPWKVPRVKCGSCGKISRIGPAWEVDSIGKYTKSFEEKVVRLSKEMPVFAVCMEMRLDDSTV